MHPGTTFERPIFDRLLEALGSRPRRQLLVGLVANDSVRVPRPGDGAAVEWVTDLDATVTERDWARLYHGDLPKLDDLGYVSWNREAGRVRRGQAFDEIAPLVELLLANEDQLPSDWY